MVVAALIVELVVIAALVIVELESPEMVVDVPVDVMVVAEVVALLPEELLVADVEDVVVAEEAALGCNAAHEHIPTAEP